MPLYYFDIYDGLSGVDRAGIECSDAEAACWEAFRRAERLLVEEVDWFGTGQEWQIGVIDCDGRLSFSVAFKGEARRSPRLSSRQWKPRSRQSMERAEAAVSTSS